MLKTARHIVAILAVGVAALVMPAVPAAADPPPPSPIKQTNTGTGNGAAFTASLKKTPAAGNSVLIVVGLDAASTVGVLEADDIAHVIDASETWTAYGVPGAPYAITFAAAAAPGVKTWGFHGVAQPVTWLAVEVAGLVTFQSGVPIWDGPATSSNHVVTGAATQMATGHRADTVNPHEVILAVFVARTTSGTPPTVSGFANTYPQAGSWARLGASVATSGAGPMHRLDVAFKEVTQVGSFDATATWSAAPSGMAAALVGFYAV